MNGIQLVKASQLKTAAGGPGIVGQLGVQYQDPETGQLYAWDPAGRAMRPTNAAQAAGASPGTGDIPIDPASTGSALLANAMIVRGGQMGPSGSLTVKLFVENFSGDSVTLQAFLGGQNIWADVTIDSRMLEFTVLNRGNTQSQISVRGSTVYRTQVNSDVDMQLAVYVTRTSTAGLVRVSQIEATPVFGRAAQVHKYHGAAKQETVIEDQDILVSPLPARVTADPAKQVRSLTVTPYVFPAKFFNASIKTWPINSTVFPPIGFSMLRTLDVNRLDWLSLQTAQATVAYTNPTGAAPSGINATQLALLDRLFAACAANGKEMVVNLCSGFDAAPAWATSLGVTGAPLSIPAPGANQTAALASLSFLVRFLCERYRGLHPAMTWWIEPINEPNSPGVWQGQASRLVALCAAVKTQVDTSGGTQVKCIASSWTDRSGISFSNPGSPALNGNNPTFHEYIGGGGWGHFNVLTYHIYKGNVFSNNINAADPLRQQGMFAHDLGMIDPLNNTTLNGRYYSLLGMIADLALGTTIVPGVSTYGGKPLWITECGDAFAATRDRHWYIRLALAATALGVERYVFYYYGNKEFGALPDMEIDVAEYEAARRFLEGASISWVNANADFTRVAAMINGRVMLF